MLQKIDSDFLISREFEKDIAAEHLFSSSSAPWQQKIIRDFLSLKKINEPKCLDAACGVGNNIRTLLQISNSICAIDRSQSAIEFGKHRYKQDASSLDFYLGDLDKMPFPSDTFDVVVCTEALEHVKDIDLVVGELCRVLKPQGRIIISFQNYLNPSIFIKPIFEFLTGKNWDAWGTHSHREGYERFLTYFNVRRSLLSKKNMRIVEVRGADYLNSWLGWFPGIRKNYNLLDRLPLMSIGKLPFIKILGMDCFILAQKY
jgi:2-polyprenyl-3-methyl-5-hydroxy-6-metoxy-1,4-benzoquinol methylase